ncbi:MAG: tagaturonate epimerase family protein, partial [Trueperaceae bacterium]
SAAAPAARHKRRIGLLAPHDHPTVAAFDGERADAGRTLSVTYGPLSPANAAALRDLLPALRPVPLGLATSAGFGDRLGLATPGHVASLRRAKATDGIRPIFAQQSIREMTRTGRTPQQVMDDATFGTFEAGWTAGVGADADHLKTEEDVRTTLAAGFTFFTFDPGDHVDDDAAEADAATIATKVEALPWDDLHDRWEDMRSRWLGSTLDADGLTLTLDEASLARAAAKYGAALAQAARLHRVLAASGRPFEIEVSVDETATPTTLEEHAFLARELRRLEVPVVSLAPRFVGRFEKGVDFRGDLDELVRTLDGHARIARTFGPYKLSLHSGSDKFSVYGPIAEATRGLVHLKTAGTSYLEALRVAAVHAPDLFRKILRNGRKRFETDRASYLIGARLDAVPSPRSLKDEELPGLLDDDDARQVLHVTFGSALDAHRDDLLELLRRRRTAHEDALARHFERHLAPFVPYANAGNHEGGRT